MNFKFIHHKSHLKPFLSHLPCIVRREYFSIIFNVKKCTLYLIKYSNLNMMETTRLSAPLSIAVAVLCSKARLKMLASIDQL